MQKEDLTREELFSAHRYGMHNVQKTLRLENNNKLSFCQCPKFNEKVPTYSFLPGGITQFMNWYSSKIHTIYGKSLFEISPESILVRPFIITDSKIDLMRANTIIRTNRIVFKGIPGLNSFSQEELAECQCYPFNQNNFKGKMMKLDSEIIHSDRNFYNLFMNNDNYTRIRYNPYLENAGFEVCLGNEF